MTRSLLDTVVVGFDGSPGSAHALVWAAADASRRGLRLHVIHVWQPPPLIPSGFPPAAMPDSEAILHDAVTRVRLVAPQLRVRTESLPAPVASAFVEASADADSIVVGAQGYRRLLRDFGSTAWQVATHATCPVVVVREVPVGDRIRPIVVGLDGSPESDRALRYAVARAAQDDVELVAVHAAPAAAVDEPADGTDNLDGWLAPIRSRHPDVRARPVTVHRHPVAALIAESRDAQLVVVGNRGRGGFRGLLLGSVGMDLVREATCPVAIVRC
ncbi:MAG: universal stress protein [Lapillicoccus sp.]